MCVCPINHSITHKHTGSTRAQAYAPNIRNRITNYTNYDRPVTNFECHMYSNEYITSKRSEPIQFTQINPIHAQPVFARLISRQAFLIPNGLSCIAFKPVQPVQYVHNARLMKKTIQTHVPAYIKYCITLMCKCMMLFFFKPQMCVKTHTPMPSDPRPLQHAHVYSPTVRVNVWNLNVLDLIANKYAITVECTWCV